MVFLLNVLARIDKASSTVMEIALFSICSNSVFLTTRRLCHRDITHKFREHGRETFRTRSSQALSGI
jgi:hypothetical protein